METTSALYPNGFKESIAALTAQCNTETSPKVPVTERAVIGRINRKLAKEDERLHVAPNHAGGENADLGRYYIVDTGTRAVIYTHQDLESLAQELNVMGPREVLAVD